MQDNGSESLFFVRSEAVWFVAQYFERLGLGQFPTHRCLVWFIGWKPDLCALPVRVGILVAGRVDESFPRLARRLKLDGRRPTQER